MQKLETISAMTLDREQPNFAAKTDANEKQYLKAMYRLALTGQASILDSKIFGAIC